MAIDPTKHVPFAPLSEDPQPPKLLNPDYAPLRRNTDKTKEQLTQRLIKQSAAGDAIIAAGGGEPTSAWDTVGDAAKNYIEQSSGVSQQPTTGAVPPVFADQLFGKGPTRPPPIGSLKVPDSGTDPSGAKGEVVTTYKGGVVRVYSESRDRMTKWFATWQGPGMTEPKVFIDGVGKELKAADFKEGTEERAKLDELVGLKPADLRQLDRVWIGKPGHGLHVLMGTTQNSSHWFLLTPDGKRGFRTYHLGDQKPDKKKIQSNMRGGAYSYLFKDTDDPIDAWQSPNHDGRKGEVVSSYKGGVIRVYSESRDRRTQWFATWQAPGMTEPKVFIDGAGKELKAADFKEGTEERAKLDELVGLKPGNLQQLDRVWIGETGHGRHALIGTTQNSSHWFLLTPDGKRGFRTYHLGDQKPDKKKIQSNMRGGAYSYLFKDTDDPIDAWQSPNHDGRKGEVVSSYKEGVIRVYSESRDRRPKWFATWQGPGMTDPVVFIQDAGKKLEAADFGEGKPGRRALDKLIAEQSRSATSRGSDRVITPTSLVNRTNVGTTDGHQVSVLVGQLPGSKSWFVLTPKAGGGYASHELKEIPPSEGQLSEQSKAQIREMIKHGEFSRVWIASKPADNPYKV